jgi:dienelactone hydrolase
MLQAVGVRRSRWFLPLAALCVLWGGWACSPASHIASMSSPANVPGSDVSWYTTPAPDGSALSVGIIRASGDVPHPAVLLVTGTEGLNTNYVTFARELATRGFDVAIGCWFKSNAPADASDLLIPCERAPEFQGVSDAALADLDALVEGAREALGHPDHLALVGFSRGGGIAMLRASTGAPEPVVSIAGMLAGTTAFGQLPGEVNVVERAGGIVAPVLLLHGVDDGMVVVDQARRMQAALLARGADVVAKYYAGIGHGMSQVDWVRHDMQTMITGFLCERFGCGLPGMAVNPG